MTDKIYRVTRHPEQIQQQLTEARHVIIKSDDGALYCQTHRCDASACANKTSDDVVWWNQLDKGRYVATVVRTQPYRGLLTLTREDRVVFQASVGIAYNAPFGPDMEDVAAWEQRCVEAADADYRRRDEVPPET